MVIQLRITMLLILHLHHSQSITTKRSNLPRQLNWESGLKEAVHQALLRERFYGNNLRELIYDAPITGHEDTISPFGDIAILARGQLYATQNHGFLFLLDSQKQCIGCNIKWPDHNRDKLIALWTVKRIRHRDPVFGHRYELEYTISPITGEDIITRSGGFDYGIPGHVFIVKTDSPIVNKRQEYRNLKDLVDGFDGYKKAHWRDNREILQKQYTGMQYLPPVITNYDKNRHFVNKDLHSGTVLSRLNPNGYYVPKFLGKPNFDIDSYDIYKNVQHKATTMLTPPYRFDVPVTSTQHEQPTYTDITRKPIHQTTTITKILIPITVSTTIKTPITKETTTPNNIIIATTTKSTTTIASSTLKKMTQKSTTKPTTSKFETQLDLLTPSDDELFGTSTERTKKLTTVSMPTSSVASQLSVPTKSTITTEGAMNRKTTRKIYTKRPTTSSTVSIRKSEKTTSSVRPLTTRATSEQTSPTIPFSKPISTIKTTIKSTTKPVESEHDKSTTQFIPIATTKRMYSSVKVQPTLSTMTTIPTGIISTNPSTIEETVTTEVQKDTRKTSYTTQIFLPTTEFTELLVPENMTTFTSNIEVLSTTQLPTELFITEKTSVINTFTTNENSITSSTLPSTIGQITNTTPLTTNNTELPTNTTSAATTTEASIVVTSAPTKKMIQTTTGTNIKSSVSLDRFDDINIFGNDDTTSKSSAKPSTTQRMINTKDVDDIFGTDNSKNKPKIIFSNFYEATIDEKNSLTKKRESLFTNSTTQLNGQDKKEEIETSTSQSVLTSISFEVNVRNKPIKETYVLEAPIKAKVKEIKNNDTHIKVFKAEMPGNESFNDTNNTLTERNKIMDHLTLSIINHAKSIKILNKKTKEPKTRRRIYGTRMKKLKQKK